MPDGDIVLDLPVPPSVNRTRKIDWAGQKPYRAWREQCDKLLLVAKRRLVDPLRNRKIEGRYELLITLDESVRLDSDNCIKALGDYICRANLVTDDSPKYLRRIVVERGEVPTGCRLTLCPMEG